MDTQFWGLGRTWAFAILLVLLASVMLWFGKISPEIWVTVSLGAAGLGTTKSSVQTYATKKFAGQTTPPTSAGDPPNNG